MLEALYNYIDSENQKDTKKKLTKNEPQTELDTAMRILKRAGYPIGILEHSKQNLMYPAWMNRMDTFDMLEMFASEFEMGLYQKTEEIENTNRLIKDLEHAHDIVNSKERTIVNYEHKTMELQKRLSRALRKLEKEGIEAKDEWGVI